ncbi:hypothetical protein NLI96_g7890 [Meripilus lineatus]|uniref:Uncharacterized protein n=1 Tax=Meripilus lineatus TaxID=2056292 RepID=A0AAD5YGT3_9APHY|nr:hypothetical protein NLI96_g7890 [Physisporinus lineatus]
MSLLGPPVDPSLVTLYKRVISLHTVPLVHSKVSLVPNVGVKWSAGYHGKICASISGIESPISSDTQSKLERLAQGIRKDWEIAISVAGVVISLNITLLTSSTSALSLPSRVICAVSIILSVLSLSFAMILTRENQGSERIIVGDSFILIVDDADDRHSTTRQLSVDPLQLGSQP